MSIFIGTPDAGDWVVLGLIAFLALMMWVTSQR